MSNHIKSGPVQGVRGKFGSKQQNTINDKRIRSGEPCCPPSISACGAVDKGGGESDLIRYDMMNPNALVGQRRKEPGEDHRRRDGRNCCSEGCPAGCVAPAVGRSGRLIHGEDRRDRRNGKSFPSSTRAVGRCSTARQAGRKSTEDIFDDRRARGAVAGDACRPGPTGKASIEHRPTSGASGAGPGVRSASGGFRSGAVPFLLG